MCRTLTLLLLNIRFVGAFRLATVYKYSVNTASRSKLNGWFDNFYNFKPSDLKSKEALFTKNIIGKEYGVNMTSQICNYFEAWNRRDMKSAVDLFASDCVYEDTLFPGVFKGREALEKHLLNVAKSCPESFEFKIDSVAEDKSRRTLGVQWHVESDGTSLPFTRGTSMYSFDTNGRIIRGFDVPEPVAKTGAINLAILRNSNNIIKEPVRLIPITLWIFYCWLLFFSDIIPGPNALQLDPHTWEEVRDLSVNYLLIVPLFSGGSPVIHPVLEALFNIILLWSTLFFGFVIDGKSALQSRNSSSSDANSMVTTLFGMQLLTNAVFLPYLFSRTTPSETEIYQAKSNGYGELSAVEKFGESKAMPIAATILVILCLVWGIEGRPEFGDLPTRWGSFGELIKGDRLGFSFVVDLVYFAAFQGWLVSSDASRRRWRSDDERERWSQIAKYVPLFGLGGYLLARPGISLSKNE